MKQKKPAKDIAFEKEKAESRKKIRESEHDNQVLKYCICQKKIIKYFAEWIITKGKLCKAAVGAYKVSADCARVAADKAISIATAMKMLH